MPWISDDEYRRCKRPQRGGILPPLRSVNPVPRINSSDIDISKAGIENTFDAIPGRGDDALFWFQFGPGTNVFVWKGPGIRGLDGALEEAASWLVDNAPGHFHEVESEEDEVDMTYTESGYLASWEWYVNELHPGNELFNEVWEATMDQLAEEGDLDNDDVEKVNKFAREYEIDAQWSLEEENFRHNPHMMPEYAKGDFAVGEVIGEYIAVPWEYRSDQDWDQEPQKETGFWVQLSAPGYLDSTGWDGPFDSLEEAKKHVEYTWGVDPETGEDLY